MSLYDWLIFDVVDTSAPEQNQGGAVALQDVEAVATTPAWTVRESDEALQIKPVPGGALELAPTETSPRETPSANSESWGVSKGAMNFAFVFLVLIFGAIILMVAMHDKDSGNLTFGKLVEELGLLVAGAAGGVLWRFKR